MAKRKSEQAGNGAGPTEYVVLMAVVLSDDTGSMQTGWDPDQTAWTVVGTYSAFSKTSAIRKHTGEGADVIEGSWRAVPLSSWRGGETTRRVTASERLPLDA